VQVVRKPRVSGGARKRDVERTGNDGTEARECGRRVVRPREVERG
jgi:hypothetical protein